ncbi:MAG: helix-turn-helix transcriptional regulator [SAR324 cluster bacterium]|nr:helix-turn-helix transcriptional regulator [SAR324 cluster bacterium]
MSTENLNKVQQKAGTSGKRLKQALDHVKYSQTDLAKLLHITPSYVSRIINDKDLLTIKNAEIIEHSLGIRASWLLSGSGNMFVNLSDSEVEAFNEQKTSDHLKPNIDNFYWLPRFDVIASCGDGQFVPENEEILETLPFKKDWIHDSLRIDPNKLVMICAAGNSMEPLITAGDSVLVKLTEQRLEDDGVYVINWNGNLRIKQLQFLFSEKRIKISSKNEDFQDEYLDESNAHELSVVGKVVWIGKKI